MARKIAVPVRGHQEEALRMAVGAMLRRMVMSFCEHRASGLGVPLDAIPGAIVRGSQHDNATMLQQADKVIVL